MSVTYTLKIVYMRGNDRVSERESKKDCKMRQMCHIKRAWFLCVCVFAITSHFDRDRGYKNHTKRDREKECFVSTKKGMKNVEIFHFARF